MKIAVVSTSDKIGGASIAAYRLFDALFKRKQGENNQVDFITAEKKSNHERVHEVASNYIIKKIYFIVFALEYIITNKWLRDLSIAANYSPAFWGLSIFRTKEIQKADIINMHWVNNSFLSLQEIDKVLKLGKPVVWHLHDMWLFTGGCHYVGECSNYLTGCGNCPVLKHKSSNDLSYRSFNEKFKLLNASKLTIVASSKWLANAAKKSKMLQSIEVDHIPIPIDTTLFSSKSKEQSKASLNLDPSKRYILFGAMNTNDERKGFKFLKAALLQLASENKELLENVEVLSFGKMLKDNDAEVGFKLNELGTISDTNTLVEIYNAADVFVIPSLEDNLPNTVLEAMSCGVPVVGFETGGIPEMVQHEVSGYIAKYRDAADLAVGINYILKHADYDGLSQKSRSIIETEYSEEVVAKKYYQLFESLL